MLSMSSMRTKPSHIMLTLTNTDRKIKTTSLLISLLISINLDGQIIDLRKCDSIKRFPITQHVSIFKTTKNFPIESIVESSDNFVKAANKPVLVMNYDPF